MPEGGARRTLAAGPLDVVVLHGQPEVVVVVLDDHRTVLDREGDPRVELRVVLRVSVVVVAVRALVEQGVSRLRVTAPQRIPHRLPGAGGPVRWYVRTTRSGSS